MPDGVVHWFDPDRGDAEIVQGGQAYHVPAGEIAAAARHPGARVHFDLRRVDGVEHAVEVRLRQSARASRHRHGFGTLQGARRFDTKGGLPHASVHPELHLAALHPLQVARAWATSVARGDLVGALALYAPDALVHLEDRVIDGRTALSGWIEATAAFACDRHAKVAGVDDGAVVSWEGQSPDEQGLTVKCRMAHGAIAEQWVLGPDETAALSVPTPQSENVPPVSLYATPNVSARAKAQSLQLVSSVVAALDTPVLFARVKLSWEPDPARPLPARAEAMLDLNGEPLRAHASAHTMTEALDALSQRLRERLEHRASRRKDLERSDGVVAPGEWRHGDLSPERPPFFDRPVEDRQLVRHKTLAAGELSVDEAVFDMLALDYDFYLFVDLTSGSDSVIERADGTTYRMTRLQPSADGMGPTAEPVELTDVEVPVLSLREAIERLGASGERRLFFADAGSGRGAVLYLRHDGHYGLVTAP